jgi:hypothetical protein
MSTPRYIQVTGEVISDCAAALTTFGKTLDFVLDSCDKAVADARAAQHAYLARQLRGRQLAVLKQVHPCLVRPASVPQLQQKAQAVLAATTTTQLEHASNALAAAVQREQQAVAVDLVPMVVEATKTSGFNKLRQMRVQDRVLIIGQDEQGHAIQTELRSQLSRPLELKSETIGIPEGRCTDVLDRFEQSLRHHGIKVKQSDQQVRRRAVQRRRVRQ